jgi:hypothetical protein
MPDITTYEDGQSDAFEFDNTRLLFRAMGGEPGAIEQVIWRVIGYAAETLTGPQGPAGPTGATGATGEAGLPNITSVNTSPGRTLNSVGYQPHATRPTVVMYSVRFLAILSLGGDDIGTLELRSDSGATPTTVVVKAEARHALGVGVGVGSTVDLTIPVVYLVPPGHYVRLVSSGDATVNLVSQTEIVL